MNFIVIVVTDIWLCSEKAAQEGENLRSYLHSAQNHIEILLEEKKNLLEVIKNLQVSEAQSKCSMT